MAAEEVISSGEERFEWWRKTTGLFLGPLVFIFLYLLPMPQLSESAHKLLSVIGFVLVFWLTEAIPIPVTALMGAVLNVALGVAPAKEVFAPFAHPLVFLFIGSFIIAKAITYHGLDRRFSFAILSIRFLEKSPLRVLFAFGLISACASMWISNTAATAMMLPIAIGILKAIKDIQAGGEQKSLRYDRFSTAMMLMVAYGASVGGISTPIGTPPNLIGIGMIDTLAGMKITFFEWMTFAVPITSVMFIFLFAILSRGGPPGGRKGGGDIEGVRAYVKAAREKLGGWKRGEINTSISFAIAVTLWVLPSIVGLIYGKESDIARFLSSRLNAGAVAVFAASWLFLLPISVKERTFTISWQRAVNIDWGTILLFGGGLSLGKLMFSTGLAEAFGGSLTGFTGASQLWTITAMGTLFAIILSETTSNTASANMVIPVMIAIAQGMDLSPIPPALGACLGASFGFMLPVSTPPNAIVYGSGLVPILSMVRKGILFDIGGFFIIMGGLMVLCPLLGYV
jgi:sodium-dependent dicarboxylate transporter 2/3/5